MNFKYFNEIFNEGLVIIHLLQVDLMLNKPKQVGCSILDFQQIPHVRIPLRLNLREVPRGKTALQ